MSDNWTNWPLVEILDFVKDVQNIEILNMEQKKNDLFLLMFSDATFNPGTVSTNMTYTTQSV